MRGGRSERGKEGRGRSERGKEGRGRRGGEGVRGGGRGKGTGRKTEGGGRYLVYDTTSLCLKP